MPEKPANEDLNEQVSNIYSNSKLEAIYEAAMDTLLAGMGRDAKFFLEPIKTLTTTNPEHYDPFSGGQDRRLGDGSTGSKGYTLEPVWVIYKAHVKHGPAEIQDGEEGVPFVLEDGDVQLTTVIGSYDDIQEAVELEVDDIKFIRKKLDSRKIGWSTPKYLISVWEKKAERHG